MTSDALTNAEKHVTSNIACVLSQRYTKYSVFWLARITLCIPTDPTVIPAFVQLYAIWYGQKKQDVDMSLERKIYVKEMYSLSTLIENLSG